MANSPGLFTLQPVHSRALTINHLQVPSTQSDFPVLFNFTDATFKTTANGGHVTNSNGYDIGFYSDAGGTTKLKWEMERYNASTGEVVSWIKISSVSSSSDTVFYMFYGNSNIQTDQSDAVNVWTNNYLGSFNFKDGSTLSIADSTGNFITQNHGATATAGQVDGGANFASASSQYIDTNNSPSVTAAMSVSAWVNATSFPNAYNTIGGYNSGPNVTYVLFFVKSTGKLACYTNRQNYDGTGSNTLSAGTTYHLAMEYDNTNGLAGYVNASSDATAAAAGALSASSATYSIGQDLGNAGRFWNGMLDCVRFHSTKRGNDWWTCEYNNQKSSQTFLTLGAEQ